MHPGRVRALRGSRLTDQKAPRRRGLSPAAWDRGSYETRLASLALWPTFIRKGGAMESVTRFVDRHSGAFPATSTPVPAATQTLVATASYLLSEDGRKASLLAGGDGRALQQVTLDVPENRLHLVSVDRQGVARLKLRPRFEMNGGGIVRIDTAPVYDAPPNAEDLYRAAARNHELETAYDAQRDAHRSRRTDDERTRRQHLAESFFADKAMRAVSNPPPTPRACYLTTDRGLLLFDIATDLGLAKDLPPEAYRRFRADQRAHEEKVRQDQIAQAALHEEKKRFVATWIAENGTAEEKTRHAAGVLPMAEVVKRITDRVFAPIDTRPEYVRDGAQRLQTFIRTVTGAADTIIRPADVVVRSTHALMATAQEWAAIREIQAALPSAQVVLRHHQLRSRRHHGVPSLVTIGVLVTMGYGPFILRREYVVSNKQSAPASVPEVDVTENT